MTDHPVLRYAYRRLVDPDYDLDPPTLAAHWRRRWNAWRLTAIEPCPYCGRRGHALRAPLTDRPQKVICGTALRAIWLDPNAEPGGGA